MKKSIIKGLFLSLPLLVSSCGNHVSSPTSDKGNTTNPPIVTSPNSTSNPPISGSNGSSTTSPSTSISVPDHNPNIPIPDVENINLRPTLPDNISERAQYQRLAFEVSTNTDPEEVVVPLYHIFQDEINLEAYNLLFVDEAYAYLVYGYIPETGINLEIGKYYTILGNKIGGCGNLSEAVFDYYDGSCTMLEENNELDPITSFSRIDADDYNFLKFDESMAFRPIHFNNLLMKDKSNLASESYLGKYVIAYDPLTEKNIKIKIESTLKDFKQTSSALNSISVGDAFNAELVNIGNGTFVLLNLPNELVKKIDLDDKLAIYYAQQFISIPTTAIRPLDLPTTMTGVNIKWKSSDTTAINENGMIYVGNKSKTVTLEGTFTSGKVSSTKTYRVTLPQSQDLKTSTYFDYTALDNNGNSEAMNGERVKNYSNLHFYGASIINTISVNNVYAGEKKNDSLGLKLGSNSNNSSSITYHFDERITQVFIEVKKFTSTETVKVTIDSTTYTLGEGIQILSADTVSGYNAQGKKDITISAVGKALIKNIIVIQ